MPRFAKARDANEPAIVEALRAAGWSVERIDPVGRNNGTPDLILGKAGYTTLAEVKRPAGPKGGRKDKRLTDVQEAWHEAWRGARPLLLDQEPVACVALCEEWLGRQHNRCRNCRDSHARGSAPNACRDLHECPFKLELYNDDEQCACCEDCTYDCALEI